MPWPPPPWQPPVAPRRDRAGRTAVLVFVLVLILCAGGATGAFFLVRDTESDGWQSPRQAVDGFLDAVFNENNPVKAADYVCGPERDPDRLITVVEQALADQDGLVDPVTSWSIPDTITVSRGLADLTVDLNVAVGDGAPPPGRRIRLTIADQKGWWVCGNGPIEKR